LAPAIAFAAAGYGVAIPVSAYTIFVLGIFDAKFGADLAFELALKFLPVFWSFHWATFLLVASTVRLATVYWRRPSWTPETAVATNPRVGHKIFVGFVLGAAFSLTFELLRPASPWPHLLLGALAGTCFCLPALRNGFRRWWAPRGGTG
jgi:hypothetical protein